MKFAHEIAKLEIQFEEANKEYQRLVNIRASQEHVEINLLVQISNVRAQRNVIANQLNTYLEASK
jgi:hypothetical protein